MYVLQNNKKNILLYLSVKWELIQPKLLLEGSVNEE